jgi:hypothetical protein
MIDRNRPYLLAGKVEENWGAVTLTVDCLSLAYINVWMPISKDVVRTAPETDHAAVSRRTENSFRL